MENNPKIFLVLSGTYVEITAASLSFKWIVSSFQTLRRHVKQLMLILVRFLLIRTFLTLYHLISHHPGQRAGDDVLVKEICPDLTGLSDVVLYECTYVCYWFYIVSIDRK